MLFRSAFWYINLVDGCNRTIRLGFSFIIALLGAFLVQPAKLPWSLDLIMITQFLFFFGYEFREDIRERDMLGKLPLHLLVAFFLPSYFSNGAVDLFGRGLGNSINYFATAISGSLMIMLFARRVHGPVEKLFFNFGQNSIYIYIYHSLFFQLVHTYIYGHFMPDIYQSNLIWLPLVTISLILGCLTGTGGRWIKTLFHKGKTAE